MRMETIEGLRDRLQALEKQTQALAHQTRAAEQRLRWWRILACGLLVLGVIILPLVGGTAQEQSAYERALARRLAALEYKLQYIDGGPKEVVITGANLRIVNGLGSTDCIDSQGEPIPDCPNGLGNLIVGYNESREIFDLPDVRTGSHNVVVGRQNNFSRFGELVVGEVNEISGDFASVSVGAFNTASGFGSSVSRGGRQHRQRPRVLSQPGGPSTPPAAPSPQSAGGSTGLHQTSSTGRLALYSPRSKTLQKGPSTKRKEGPSIKVPPLHLGRGQTLLQQRPPVFLSL
jgi:hypothetical protein